MRRVASRGRLDRGAENHQAVPWGGVDKGGARCRVGGRCTDGAWTRRGARGHISKIARHDETLGFPF